jgi:hypothetical protein
LGLSPAEARRLRQRVELILDFQGWPWSILMSCLLDCLIAAEERVAIEEALRS